MLAKVFVLCATVHFAHSRITMEGWTPLYRRVGGIDVHRMLHVFTVLVEQPDGSIDKHRREFGGFKLGAVISDINGVSARAMARGLNEGHSPAVLLAQARGALKRKTQALSASLEGDLSARHLFVFKHIQSRIDTLQRELAEIDAYLVQAMQPYAWAHGLLQTIPGINEIAAALIVAEIGDDMARFGSAARLACWAALSPGNNDSAGKRKSGRTRHGNNAIRFIL